MESASQRGGGRGSALQLKPVGLAEGDGWQHPRMWAQYGENHKGVVLVFDRRRLLQNAYAQLKNRGSLVFGQVFYTSHHHPGDCLPFTVRHAEWTAEEHSDFAQKHLERFGDWLFFTKHEDWAHESEARILFHGSSDQEEFIPIEGALVELCLGGDFPVEETASFGSFASDLNCNLSGVVWRNGLPVRIPAPP